MRKTLQFLTLAGVIITCWLSSEKPSYADIYCSMMDNSYCDSSVIDPRDASLCFTDTPVTYGTCYCRNYSWQCTY